MGILKSITGGLALLSTTAGAQYTLQEDYFAGNNFFGQFSFFSGTDPTQGFVQYQSKAGAQKLGLISSSAGNAVMRVSSTGNTPNGRPSVRIASKNSYNQGLVIVDIEHMPGGICGTWPAFWMVGPNWPNDGEIDIIEGVNDQAVNDMTLHTSQGCTVPSGGFSGTQTTDNCYIDAAGQGANQGCGITTSKTATYGAQFNANKGGVYATQITSNRIAIWFWARGHVPLNVRNGHPVPSSWGEPLAQFAGGSGCDLPAHFQKLQLVFDTTLCGSWAGNVWTNSATCKSKAATCDDFVANHPAAFVGAYWSVNALKVYQDTGSQGTPPPPPSSLTTTTQYVGPTPNLQTPWYGAGAPSSATGTAKATEAASV